MDKEFPEGMVPIGSEKIQFSCHEGVACFTLCCKNVDMLLFPYDIICLKNTLGIDSEQFLRKYTRLVQGDNPYFPSLMLKLDEQQKSCPFLQQSGCSVYGARPSSCRTYPLERAVDRSSGIGRSKEYYFLTQHDYCLGHNEDNYVSIKEWVRNQRIDPFNVINDLWTEMDTLFATNPWKGEGSGGERQQLAFMVCYNIDEFRNLVNDRGILKQFQLAKNVRNNIKKDDVELLKFGFEWLKLVLGGNSSLIRK